MKCLGYVLASKCTENVPHFCFSQSPVEHTFPALVARHGTFVGGLSQTEGFDRYLFHGNLRWISDDQAVDEEWLLLVVSFLFRCSPLAHEFDNRATAV